jgi:hypothetical protein
MRYRRRIYFTAQQRSEIWDRWQHGESTSSIGRGLDRNSSSIYPLLSRTGGIRPPARAQSRLALTLVEREEIAVAYKWGAIPPFAQDQILDQTCEIEIWPTGIDVREAL